MVLLNAERKPEELAEHNPELERRLKLADPDTADQVIWGIVGGIAVLAMVALIRLWV